MHYINIRTKPESTEERRDLSQPWQYNYLVFDAPDQVAALDRVMKLWNYASPNRRTIRGSDIREIDLDDDWMGLDNVDACTLVQYREGPILPKIPVDRTAARLGDPEE